MTDRADIPGCTVAEAARRLRVSPATVRRRVRSGQLRAVVGDGTGGRNRGYRVELPDSGSAVADPLLEFLRVDCGLFPSPVPAHVALGIDERTAARYLLMLARYLDRRPGTSEALRTLRAIAITDDCDC